MINPNWARPPGTIMSEPEDVGAAAERRQRRRWLGLFGLAIACGLATGLAFALTSQGPGFGAGSIPPILAAVGAAVYLVMMIGGSYAMFRVTDEVEVDNNVRGLAAGGGALLLVYPAWWMLWQGGLVAEPTHDALFLLMFGAALAYYLWKKYR